MDASAANAAKYWPVGGGFIFSVQGEGGIIKSFDNSGDPGSPVSTMSG